MVPADRAVAAVQQPLVVLATPQAPVRHKDQMAEHRLALVRLTMDVAVAVARLPRAAREHQPQAATEALVRHHQFLVVL